MVWNDQADAWSFCYIIAMAPPRVWNQTITTNGDVATIDLWHPYGRTYTAIFDTEFVDKVAVLNWSPASTGYLAARQNGKVTRLHWLVLGLEPGRGLNHQIDHIDRDKTNNLRSNLHECSHRENNHNRCNQSEYGVCVARHTRSNQFLVQVRFDNKFIYNPTFSDSRCGSYELALQAAKSCSNEYSAIATRYDNDEIELPTKDDLKAIADKYR